MQKLLSIMIPRLAWLYIYFVGITSRVVWLNIEEKVKMEKAHGSFIYAFWHGRQILINWAYRNTGYATLVSRSTDGEYIARVIDLFGVKSIRGSSSRGGARSLIELKKMLEKGGTVAMTPDGPRGPKRTISPGVLFLAQKSAKPILPVTNSASRKLIFHGWDDYWVPLPFSRIAVALGRPVTVGPHDDFDKKAAELAGELNRITDMADAFVQGKSINPPPTVTANTSHPPFHD